MNALGLGSVAMWIVLGLACLIVLADRVMKEGYRLGMRKGTFGMTLEPASAKHNPVGSKRKEDS